MKIALQVDVPGLVDTLQAIAGVEAFVLPTADELKQPIEVDALLGTAAGGEQLAEIFNHCQGLRWVHILGTGVDKFPLDLVQDKLVSCSRGATAVPISEWALAMMLAHEKQLPSRWLSEPPEAWYLADLGCLESKTLGIVGFGAIGQAVAKRAMAFDMKVIAKVRTHRASPMPGVELVETLEALLGQSDHVVLALPATAQSMQLIKANTLAMMKPGAHLVNVSRADLVDQSALRKSLDAGRLARASLDVVEPEPLPAGHWLYSHPQVFLSAHVSWSGPNMQERIIAPFIDNVKAFVKDQPLQGIVNTSAGY